MSTNVEGQFVSPNDAKPHVIASFVSGYSYFAKHIPSGEEWYILGIDVKGDRVCAAGYPASIGKLSDCEEFKKNKPLELSEVEYRTKTFGQNWL
jgi:hypothetical protein